MTFDSGSRRAGMYIYADTASSSGPGYAYQIWQRENDLGIWEVTSGSHTRQAYANLSASNGQTYSYKASYDPATGVITVWRNNVYAVSWTAGTPRTSGNQLILRTTDSQARFDDIKVNGTTLTYLHSDHLGSNSLMSKNNGTMVLGSQTFYLPFGDYRGTAPSQALTDRGYTGHKENMELGLIYMNARYYLPNTNRMISPDTIVPNPTNPQSFNRYSYVLNNPVNFTDPSGHTECDDDCSGSLPHEIVQPMPLVKFTGAAGMIWTSAEMAVVRAGAMQVAQALFEASDGQFVSPREAFLAVYGGTVTFYKTGTTSDKGNLGEATAKDFINVYNHRSKITDPGNSEMWAAHELGHAFNYALSPNQTEPDYLHGQGLIDLAQEGVWVGGDLISGAITSSSWLGPYKRDFAGYTSNTYPYIQNDNPEASEDFADMFSNYAYNSFYPNDYGIARYNFMDNHMSNWIALAVANNE